MPAGLTTHPAVLDLAAGRLSTEQFRTQLSSAEVPLRVRVSAEEVDVTFVHETGDTVPTEAEVRLRELVGSGPTGDRVLRPVGDTPFRALTVRMLSDLRLAYAFEIHEPGQAPRLVPDALNPPPPRLDQRLAGCVLELPDAAELPVDLHLAAAASPRVDEHTFRSQILGNERPVWVSTPPGWAPGGDPCPCVIVFDGSVGHTAPAVRDSLVARGLVRDVVVVLVDAIGLRDVELTANPDFSRMLAEELVPWLCEGYGISDRAGDVALSGSSFGGLCAAWTALQHPDVFGNALLQSPSCWFHPSLPSLVRAAAEHQPEVVGQPVATPTLIEAFATAEPVPVRIFHEVGRVEHGPPPAQIRQVFGNRWLHDILRLKGYDTTYREYAGGHDALWWRATWADGLRWLFPAAGSSETPVPTEGHDPQ